MGTWSVPKTTKDIHKLIVFKNAIKKMQTKCADIAGNDELFDAFDAAQENLQRIINDAYINLREKYREEDLQMQEDTQRLMKEYNEFDGIIFN